MIWSPTEIYRVVEVLQTSTRPMRVETDAGPALVKYCGNPQGYDALISEWLAANLLEKLGIDAPDFSLMRLSALDVSSLGAVMEYGPAFVTRWEPAAITFSGSASILEKTTNPEVITQVLVFDTWIKNKDRFTLTSSMPSENLDNLLFVPDGRKIKMMVIDHSHSFTETTFDDGLDDDWWEDREVCGKLPNFDTFVRENVLISTLDAIGSLSTDYLASVLDSVPTEWGLTAQSKQRLQRGLQRRAEEMQEWLPTELLRQPPLAYELGQRQ